MIEHWYAASPFDLENPPQAVASMDADLFLVHAKTLGTATTLCGRSTMAWRKAWVEFWRVNGDRTCRACAAAVHEERRRRMAASAAS